METLIWEREPPELRDPVLVAAFEGWNDAASAATTALEAVAASARTEVIARIDPEEFFDFQANRPTIRLAEGQARTIDWPTNTLLAGRTSAGRDLLILDGTEPSTRWRTFCGAVLDAAERCGATMLVTLGALIAEVAHTRPVPVTGLASRDDLVERLGVRDVGYEGPTGIVGVLHAVSRERDLPAASLWAAIPHYAAAVPNAKAALALVRRLEGLIEVTIDASDLEERAEIFVEQVSRAVAANPEVREHVERLEEEQDDSIDLSQDVPSGEAIASELQRFLREHGEGK